MYFPVKKNTKPQMSTNLPKTTPKIEKPPTGNETPLDERQPVPGADQLELDPGQSRALAVELRRDEGRIGGPRAHLEARPQRVHAAVVRVLRYVGKVPHQPVRFALPVGRDHQFVQQADKKPQVGYVTLFSPNPAKLPPIWGFSFRICRWSRAIKNQTNRCNTLLYFSQET